MTDNSPIDRESVDPAEVAKLLVKHQGAILGYSLACLRSHADADDVFQNVSMAAVELRGQLQDIDGFLPWVRQIARYRVLKFIEKPNRLTPMSSELISQLAEVANESWLACLGCWSSARLPFVCLDFSLPILCAGRVCDERRIRMYWRICGRPSCFRVACFLDLLGEL